jgi:CheY-like chemotaxis protein
MNPVAIARRVLIVGPDPALSAALVASASRSAQVDCSRTFKSARAYLSETTYDLIVTDLRLSEYNGLHLVYLSKFSQTPPRAIVYDTTGDIGLATDIHRAGAFFEVASRLVITLPSYLAAPLPPADRRTPAVVDRRTLPRGGRRLWDRHLLAHASSSSLV